MGQLNCKNCEDRFKQSALVAWSNGEGGGGSCHSDGHDTQTTANSLLTRTTGRTSSVNLDRQRSDLDRQRSNRIKNKKRSVVLHAEFRDRQGILAPPLVTETLMEDTDNVFSGQDLGVDVFSSGRLGSPGSLFNWFNKGGGKHGITTKMTPEEDAFLDRALSDDDNFVFDGLTTHMRQRLKDSMERVEVSANTLLIKKGDNPDYLYLVQDGEIAVYIDPNEYIDENAVETGKHAPIDIALHRKNSNTSSTSPRHSGRGEPKKREFKQSYVLQLRKSMFQSSYNEDSVVRDESDGIVGKVLSVVRKSFLGPDSRASTLSGILEDTGSAGGDEDAAPSFDPLSALRGLEHGRDLGRGDVFGELGLLYNCPRTASCLATTNCILYLVDGNLFKSILSSANSDRAKKRYTESRAAIEALHNLGVFSSKDEKTLQDMGSVLNPVTFDQGDLVNTKGAYGHMMYFVMAGKLIAHDIGTGDSMKVNIELSEGGHFGELNLLTRRPSIASITVISPKARLMAITKKDYMKRRISLEPLVKKLWFRTALLTIPVIAKSKLSPHEINSLVHKLELISFPIGNISFTGNMKSALFIVESGKIQMSELTKSGGKVNTFNQLDHFGGRSLIDTKFFERKRLQVRAIQTSECVMLTRVAIMNAIGDIRRLGKPSVPVSRKLIKGMELSDIILHRIIGVGNFGRVWLVQHKTSSEVYALKVMDKKEIMQRKMTKGVIREKNVMASVEHPFISNLLASFQDKQSLYMLMSYVQGGELFNLIYNVSKKGYLSNDAAAFYGACLVEALHHLHSRNICHRDLKPENVLVNASGYVVLIDFGFAKVVLDKTFTMCGSPEYMAPEMLLGKGHSLGVDHWALGVILYEMLVGQTPFIHISATRVTLFRRICNGSFAFPNPTKHAIAVNDTAKLFVRGLLNINCEERIGSSLKLGDEEIRKNAWFQGLLTEYKNAFLSQKISPPWLPAIDDELDASYFGSHDNIEKELLSKKNQVLDNKAQRLFEDFGHHCLG